MVWSRLSGKFLTSHMNSVFCSLFVGFFFVGMMSLLWSSCVCVFLPSVCGVLLESWCLLCGNLYYTVSSYSGLFFSHSFGSELGWNSIYFMYVLSWYPVWVGLDFLLLFFGLVFLLTLLYLWSRLLVRESRDYGEDSMNYASWIQSGMFLFLTSELMLFFGLFWSGYLSLFGVVLL